AHVASRSGVVHAASAPDVDKVPRLRREDVRRVGGALRLSAFVERREADAALDDQRVPPSRHDLAEAHPADRVRSEPGLHSNLDGHAAESQLTAKRYG